MNKSVQVKRKTIKERKCQAAVYGVDYTAIDIRFCTYMCHIRKRAFIAKSQSTTTRNISMPTFL